VIPGMDNDDVHNQRIAHASLVSFMQWRRSEAPAALRELANAPERIMGDAEATRVPPRRGPPRLDLSDVIFQFRWRAAVTILISGLRRPRQRASVCLASV